MFVAGIDVGSVAAKAVVLELFPLSPAQPPGIAGTALMPTGWDTAGAGREVLARACSAAGLSATDVAFTVATGYGRVALPFANKSLTEIGCHARGAAHLFPDAGLVLDIGGQDSKAISLEQGAVRDFVMNDKCAAGTGRFLQVVSGILNLSLDALGEAAAQGTAVDISSMCAVFAETEIVGLLAKGTAPADIAAGVFRSLARRMCTLARRLPMRGACVFTGGLANSRAFADMLARELGCAVHVPQEPQLVGALGAALHAMKEAQS